MEISEFTEVLMEAKDDKGLSFEDLGKLIDRSEMWTAALLFGQAQATEDEARKITSALGLEVPWFPPIRLFIASMRSCRFTDFPSKLSSMRSSVTAS
jgi:cyanate lyase